MRRPRVLSVRSTLCVLLLVPGLFGTAPGGIASQEVSYRPAIRPDTVLEAPSGLRLRVLVDSAALGGTELEVAELTFPGGARTGGGHRHGATELFYVLSGTLDHVVEGRTHRLGPGMVGIVRAGDEVRHTVVSGEPVRVLAIWAPGGELDRIRPAFRPVTPVGWVASVTSVAPAAAESDGEGAPYAAELDRLRERWSRAYEEGDSATLASLYTPDVVRMPYDAKEQVGRDAVMEGYASSFRSRSFLPDIELVPHEVRLVGEEVVERGAYRELLHPRNGGRTLVEEGKYVSMARRDAGGGWRYSLSIFNRDAPARPVEEDASPDPEAGATPAPPPTSSTCTGPRFREFDYWAGTWAVHNMDGDRIGTNTITPVSEGCALLERWQPVRGPAGISVNHYDPVRDRWEQLWVGGGGLVLRLAGGLDEEGVMTLTAAEPREGGGGPVLDRIRWVPEADGSVHQIWDVSPDGGESWRTSFVGIYRAQER